MTDQSDIQSEGKTAFTRNAQPVSKRPWCDTCGKDVQEVLCPTCAKWWADNPLPAPEWPEGLNPELARRMVALVRRIVAAADTFGGEVMPWEDEKEAVQSARAILAAMEPDPLVEVMQRFWLAEFDNRSAAHLRAELSKRGFELVRQPRAVRNDGDL